MATLSSSVSSIHKDIRSEARGFRRDKQHSTKWSFGARPGAGKNISMDWEAQAAATEGEKLRPQKKWSHVGHGNPKNNANVSMKADPRRYYATGLQGRAARKHDAFGEISSSPPNVAKSLIDLLPSSTQHTSRSSSVDNGITYSFDAAASPRKAVGLDSLVDKAEKEFVARETDKMVHAEYEFLDDEGESVPLPKKGKKGSPKQKAVVAEVDDEDDWERI